MKGEWRFALPPSLGRESARERARAFAAVLYEAGFSTVWPLPTYAAVEEQLFTGEIDAAWGPPLVCARIEAQGGRVALRSLRWGAPCYRSALLCRAGDRLDLHELGKSRRRPRAVWVDEFSMSGYLLPRAHLSRLGVTPSEVLFEEKLAGSFEACLQNVLEGDADLTACFSAAARSNRPRAGYVELLGVRADELRVVDYTAECPSDGIVLSPRLSADAAAELGGALTKLVEERHLCRQLALAFDVDGFEPAPPGSYREVLQLV